MTEAIERLLGAEAFDAEGVRWLAERKHVADALTKLGRIVRSGGWIEHNALLGILHDQFASQSLRLWRLVCGFGIAGESQSRFDTLPPLRQLRRSKPGRLALACVGDLPSWAVASRTERAGFVLHKIVAERAK